jgi:hypothetical protein
LDHNFILELGLEYELAKEDETDFLKYIYRELQLRVGERLTANIPDEKLLEYGYFAVDKDLRNMRLWLDKNCPNYKDTPEYKAIVTKLGASAPEADVLGKFGSEFWLKINRPNYPKVVAEVLELIKKEISQDKKAYIKNWLSKRGVLRDNTAQLTKSNETSSLKQNQVPQNTAPQQPKPIFQANTSVVDEIIQGKKSGVRFGGYSWRVLDVTGDRALLLTEDIIEKRAYNVRFEIVTWKSCTLRRYLNREFVGRFIDQEQAQISRSGVFLLSTEEVVRYFGGNGKPQKRPNKNSLWINDKFNIKRMADYGGKACWWWLRSSDSEKSNLATAVSDSGYVSIGGRHVHDDSNVGVRPALWLNLKS